LKRYLSIAILQIFVWSNAAKAQEFSVFKTMVDFIPSGWQKLSYAEESNLRADGTHYAAMVIESTQSSDPSTPRKRALLIFFRSAGTYNLMIRNMEAILVPGEGGDMVDPFCGIQFDEGMLSICVMGGANQVWKKVFRFQLFGRKFLLVSCRFDQWDRHTGRGVSNEWDYLKWVRIHSLINTEARSTASFENIGRSPFLINLINFNIRSFNPERFEYHGD